MRSIKAAMSSGASAVATTASGSVNGKKRQGEGAKADLLVKFEDKVEKGTLLAEDVVPKNVAKSIDILEHSMKVHTWKPGVFTHRRKLQDAMRNHGSVELMETKDRVPVAVKRMPTRWMTTSAAEFASAYPTSSEKPWFDLAVVQFLEQHNFPYVCHLQGIFQDHDMTYVVSDFAAEGDLFSWCETVVGYGKAREAQIRPLARQLFSAVAWMHDLGIVHRDISLENTLLHRDKAAMPGEQLNIKLIDFGMSTTARIAKDELRGKVSYQAPEMHDRNRHYDGFRTDTFSLGVLLYCLTAQDYPWQSTSPGACQLFQFVCLRGYRVYLERRKLRKGRGERLFDVFTPQFVDLTEGLLAVSPADRLTLGERCFNQEAPPDQPPRSVWDMEWLDDWAS